jgi:pimeloyl-ACP methyl ester carboxylesterase
MRFILFVFFALAFAPSADCQSHQTTQFLSVSGKKLAYRSHALQSRRRGEPVVIFESGLGSGKESFDFLIPFLPKDVAWVAYDRAGVSQSEGDTTIVTDADVVKRLHQFLAAKKVVPPYLLVGHSLGGPFIRLFTSLYPSEVAGLVFIDPTNYMLGQQEDEQIKTASGSAMGYKELFLRMNEKFSKDTSLPTPVRQEMKRVSKSMQKGFFHEYSSLNPLPNIPVAVLIAYNSPVELHEEQLSKEFKLNSALWFKEVNNFRVQDYAELIKDNDNSSVILLPGYQHVIHHRDPRLAARTILQVYRNALKPKQGR